MRWQAVGKMLGAMSLAVAMTAAPSAIQAQASDTVLKPADMQKMIPASVYYCGQTATTQARNSGGVKFADGLYVLATMVDTSGYSTAIATKYQAYFITETAIKIGGEDLAAGIYGIGFIADNKFVVTDVGGHDLLTVNSGDDEDMKRPTPLQIVADPAGGFRLYGGRRYVHFNR
jgi:hypothetical protein